LQRRDQKFYRILTSWLLISLQKIKKSKKRAHVRFFVSKGEEFDFSKRQPQTLNQNGGRKKERKE
jgi:hypothetical protein